MIAIPRLTVGLPVFNGELYIRETIESILGQTYSDYQLLISDNASTDHTLEICEDYAEKDSRISVFPLMENMGAAWNFNRVFEKSSTDYFKWASSDDICAPTFFARCIEVLDQDDAIILSYPKSAIINESGEVIEACEDRLHLLQEGVYERYAQFHQTFRDETHKSNPIFGVIRSNGLAKTQLIGSFAGSDVILLGELARLGKIYEIPETLFLRRDHPQASVRVYKLQERGTWFDPNICAKYQFAKWRLLRAHLNSVKYLPHPWSIRSRCLLQIGQWTLWNLKPLRRETRVYLFRIPLHFPLPLFNAVRRIWRLGKAIRRLFLSGSNRFVNKI